jgi:Flp pilus assembly protein TadG
MRALLDLIRRFGRDSRGNMTFTFAIVTVPLLTAVGAATDYSLATRMRAKLQSAADAAAVASISQQSPGFLAASQMSTDGTVTAGVNDANKVFNGIMGTITGYTGLSEIATVTKTGANLKSSVTFTAQVPTTFMKLVGFQTMTLTGSSSASAILPLYLDFYLALDVSGSMGLPSTAAEAQRMQQISPDNYIQYPTGCTLACHFAPQKSACTDPANGGGTQGYPTNGYCLGYAISRVSQAGYQSLLQAQSPSGKYPYKNLTPGPNHNKSQQLPDSIVTGAGKTSQGVTYASLGNTGLPGSLLQPASIGGGGLTAVTSCKTAGTDACIQLRLDAVGFALNATQQTDGVDGMLALAQGKEKVANQFRIGLYPFITDIDPNYAPLTSTINGSSSTPGTINYAAANLATELDTNMNSALGSGGTHIDTAINSVNRLITNVGDGTTASKTMPYVFIVTDGAQDPQMKGVPNGGWSGSNHATTINPTTVCTPLKNRGIKIAVLYIPYVTISPVNSSFANDEDDAANANIPNIPTSLQNCASPPDAAGSYFYTANTPQDITDSLKAMFNHAITVAHITN